MKEGNGTTALIFWDYLDELRSCLVRITCNSQDLF